MAKIRKVDASIQPTMSTPEGPGVFDPITGDILVSSGGMGSETETKQATGVVEEAPTGPEIPGTFKDVETGRTSGITAGGKTYFGLTGEEVALFAEQQGLSGADIFPLTEGRKLREVGKTAEELAAELGGKIATQPGLQPGGIGEPILETTGAAGLIIPAFIGNMTTKALEVITGKQYGRTSGKELAQTTFGKILGTGILATGIPLAAIYASPLMAKVFATKVMTASIAAKSTVLLGGLGLTGVTAYFVKGQVLDYKGGELDTMRSIVGSYTEDGERMQALVTQGGDPVATLELLQKMSDEIDYAESVIKEIGNKNVQFRYEKEWLEDMKDIRSARLALQRRAQAIYQISATGKVTLDPNGLMQIAAEFDEVDLEE
jgi:hypothetical protein